MLSFKDEVCIILPKLFNNVIEFTIYYIIWKINLKEILSEDCFVKFIVDTTDVSYSILYIYNIKYF